MGLENQSPGAEKTLVGERGASLPRDLGRKGSANRAAQIERKQGLEQRVDLQERNTTKAAENARDRKSSKR